MARVRCPSIKVTVTPYVEMEDALVPISPTVVWDSLERRRPLFAGVVMV